MQEVRIIDGDHELEKHSRTSPDVQFKETSWTKQKLDLGIMQELEKPFKKNKSKYFFLKNQCQNAACEQKTKSENKKFGSNKRLGPD